MDAAAVGAASLGIGVLRFVTRPPTPDDYDAIGFVLAIGDYDLGKLQPHPPGYPVYVALAKVAHAVGASPLAAATAVSSVAAAVTGAALWVAVARLARDWVAGADRASGANRAAWIALLLYGGAALPWTTGGAALSDSTACAFAVLAAALLLVGRPGIGGLALGLMLGTRASYAPLALSWLALAMLARSGSRWRALGGVTVGVAAWLAPFVAIVGAGQLMSLAGAHLRGHFTEWGGTIATRPDLMTRAVAFVRGLVFDGLAPAWWAMCVLGGAMLVGLVRLVKLATGHGAIGPSLTRPPAGIDRWRLAVVLMVILPYALWVFFGQNVIEQPRHVLPLVVVLIVALARSLEGTPLTAALVVAVLWAASLPVALAHRRTEAPGAQLAAWIMESRTAAGSADTVLFGGRSIRFARLLAPGLAVRERTWLAEVDVDLERMDRLPRHILVTSEVEPDSRRRPRLRPGPRFCRDARIERQAPCIQIFEYAILEGASP